VTIQEALSECGIEFLESGHQHSRPGWIQTRDCPFCGSANFHLGYNITAGYWNCWRCSYHPTWEVFKALGVPAYVAKQLNKDFAPAPDRTRGELKEPAHRGPLLKAHVQYLRSRHLDPGTAQELWGAQGIGIAPRLSWRIYIPILHNGKRVSWTTRTIGNSPQRYISASFKEESMNHKELVYGLDYVRDTALVVEGPLDVWNVGPGAVGLFGTAYSTAQVKLLAKVPNRFVCFDNSREAQRLARQLAHELSCFPGRTQLLQIEAEDPGSASKQEVTAVRQAIGLDGR
jgi:hypothetical protein